MPRRPIRATWALSRLVRPAALGLALLGGALLAGTAAQAQSCNDPSGFPTWLDGIRREAASEGISQGTIQRALGTVGYDRSTIQHDRGQRVFHQSFEQFSGRMVPPRIARARSLIARYRPVFDRIEQRYGVQAPVLAAIWGLETDFGANIGSFPTIRSLATLAYDCRRADRFHGELIDALRIVDRGDLNPATMRGAWAGEIGQTQLMPSSYLRFAVDFDGDGRRDLLHSVPDVMASTAAYLAGYGWQRDGDWAPGSGNFGVIQQWNASSVYSRTIALLATRIAGNAGE